MLEFPIFTLAEANATLSAVQELTERLIADLAAIDAVWGKLPFTKYNAVHQIPEADYLRARWARDVAALGVQPKGYFVVDFQSPDPDTVYCWAHGEDSVTHEHKNWETFIDRRIIIDVERFEAGPPPPPFGDDDEHFIPDESTRDQL